MSEDNGRREGSLLAARAAEGQARGAKQQEGTREERRFVESSFGRKEGRKEGGGGHRRRQEVEETDQDRRLRRREKSRGRAIWTTKLLSSPRRRMTRREKTRTGETSGMRAKTEDPRTGSWALGCESWRRGGRAGRGGCRLRRCRRRSWRGPCPAWCRCGSSRRPPGWRCRR